MASGRGFAWWKVESRDWRQNLFLRNLYLAAWLKSQFQNKVKGLLQSWPFWDEMSWIIGEHRCFAVSAWVYRHYWDFYRKVKAKKRVNCSVCVYICHLDLGGISPSFKERSPQAEEGRKYTCENLIWILSDKHSCMWGNATQRRTM